MKIKILDISEEGIDIAATTEQDRWYKQVLQDAFQEDFHTSDHGTLKLHLLRSCDNIMISGATQFSISPACDRCLEVFQRNRLVPLKINLSPRPSAVASEEESDDMGDIDQKNEHFAFYDKDEIDLAATLREMLLLEVPFRYLCSEDCKGLCPQCGTNLNKGKCPCKISKGDPLFAVLKNLLKHHC